jgi:hypothetical protein
MANPSSYLPPSQTPGVSDLPTHVPGTNKGEEMVLTHGHEPGRAENSRSGYYRSARDATSLNADLREPIDPRMPSLPPQ